jgi:FkbM family methyltransferase
MRNCLLATGLLLGSCAHHQGTQPGSPHAQGAASPHQHGYAKDFSASAAFAAHFDSPERDAWQKPDEVVRLLQVAPDAFVVDLGAGTGYFEGPLSRAVGPNGRVLALDTEPNMVSHLEHRIQENGWPNVEARRVAPDDPGLAPHGVDRILIVNTWHHISDREVYATKLREALRERGSVMVVDFTRESDMGPPPEHRLSQDEVVRELSAAGLQAHVLEETLPKQYVVLGTRP